MWTDGIILLGALICAILLLLLGAVVEQVNGEVEEVSLSKWDSSEIWKELPELPAKWGEQYDLKLERDCGVQDEFVPIVTMPKEMIGDLFAKQQPLEDQSAGLLGKGRTWFKSFVSTTTSGIKEKFEEATGKVKGMMSDFQKKKTDAVKNVKEKLDRKTDGIETRLKKTSGKGSFEEYQESLQQAMNPCLNEMKDAIKGHESKIDFAKREVNDLLSQLKNCTEGNPTGGGAKERISALFGTIQCTTKTLANQIKNQLVNALRKLADAVKKAGTLKKEVDGANKCIDEPPKHDQVEKQQAKLVGLLGQCK